MKKRVWRNSLFLFLSLFCLLANAQGEKKRIEIKQADKGIYKANLKKTRLIGNVILEHEGALMYCDSAWRFDQDNTAQAFGDVTINQGDTLFLYGDYLRYNGNTKLAIVTGDSVILEDPQVRLTTTQINLDRNTNQAYYTTGGRIVNDENVLRSKIGQYNTVSKVFVFKRKVSLVNPRYTIESDTLRYNSNSRYAYFLGPTTITSDSSLIKTTNGQYNTVRDVAQFRRETRLYSNNKMLTGDSLYYEKNDDFGEVFGHLYLHDTVDNYVIRGDYGQYTGARDSVLVTKEPLYSVLDEDAGDSLHLHGDILMSSNRLDSNLEEYRQLRVYKGARFFKTDIQGASDSLTYNTLDSIFYMYYNPVVWNDSTQISGDTILMTTRKEQLDSLKVYGKAFIIGIVDSLRTNQVSGRTMFGQFVDNGLKRVFVDGNAQSLYYAKEDNGKFIGLNKSLSANIIIRFVDKKLDKIGYLKKPEATMFPMDKITSETSMLEGYNNRFGERPNQKEDLFQTSEEKQP